MRLLMKACASMATTLVHSFVHSLVLFTLVIVWSMPSLSLTSSLTGNITDRLALLSFKSFITEDPSGRLDAWNDTANFCHWPGILCDNRQYDGRVTSLDLPALNLSGNISPFLGNLTYLRRLHMPSNHFKGGIPPELGTLQQLQYLNLSINSLEGGFPTSLCQCLDLETISLKRNMLGGNIPPNISLCSNLRVLDLESNRLVGVIPTDVGFLSKLTGLLLYNNSLEGSIPSSIGNLSALLKLDLQDNKLNGYIPPEIGLIPSLTMLNFNKNSLFGQIPSSIGNLSYLQELQLGYNSLRGGIPTELGRLEDLKLIRLANNQLSGEIPRKLFNLSSLSFLTVAKNCLSGSLPSDFGSNLPRIQGFYLQENQFHGPIPASMPNASMIETLQLSNNSFNGQVPPNIGTMRYLSVLNLGGNKMMAKDANSWNFFTALTNCSFLKEIDLSDNLFGGTLPNCIGNLSLSLVVLILKNNNIFGQFPQEIGHLRNLNRIKIDNNSFYGSLPDNIGSLSKLVRFSVSNNSLSGEIPFSLGNLSLLNKLYLDQNKFTGRIPDSLGNLEKLTELDLSYNNFSGMIARGVIGLSSLSSFLNISNNFFIGALPQEVGRLVNLKALDVSKNQFSGTIPSSLGGCLVLEYLDMGSNSFQGTIPQSLDKLRGLQLLNLSDNHLNGSIPSFLEELSLLQNLDLSFNNFEGQVPKKQVFSNASSVSVAGNKKLCGGISELHLQSCRVKYGNTVLVISLVSTAIALSAVVLLFFFYKCFMKKKSKNTSRIVSMKRRHFDISYSELFHATDGFSSANLLGMGSFGSVYKGILEKDENLVVAVKVLNCLEPQALASFMAECKILRNIRHRNLLRVLTTCSSIDSNGNDFLALVFGYMQNGSLESWLHSVADSNPQNLVMRQRISIAFDVALALDYLHHQCQVPIVHCDLKPSNILLDNHMAACVGDFGLARFLPRSFSTSSDIDTTSLGIKGTIGYIPPEYGMGRPISTEGDVYSYGIMMLEMFTGKRPTDEAFSGDLNLRSCVEQNYPKKIFEITDPRLQPRDGTDTSGVVEQCLIKIMGIGLACSKESPIERMGIRDVLNHIHVIRDLST